MSSCFVARGRFRGHTRKSSERASPSCDTPAEGGASYRLRRRKAVRLLAGDPEPARRLGRSGLVGLRLILGGGRRLRGLVALAARDPGVGELKLAQRLADLARVLAEQRLDDRQQGAHALDRLTDLLRVALVLGSRAQTGLSAAQVQKGNKRLDEEILDADLLQLGLVGRRE